MTDHLIAQLFLGIFFLIPLLVGSMLFIRHLLEQRDSSIQLLILPLIGLCIMLILGIVQ